MTLVLERVEAGDEAAKAQLLELAYEELRKVAGGMMRRERTDHTLQPTALVNEAVIRLLGEDALAAATNRAYFFGIMANVMRRVLVDHARKRDALRRGGDRQRASFDVAIEEAEGAGRVDVLDLDEALNELAAVDQRQAQIVTLRFFGGLSIPEIAEHLDVSVSTVEKDWRFARAWLRRQLGE
jgi:RNA polymerase sigma factor (TIGR02999 family)